MNTRQILSTGSAMALLLLVAKGDPGSDTARELIPHDTVAHEILKTERDALGSNETEYDARLKRLNEIIDEAVSRILEMKVDESNPDDVKKIFSTVDQVLVDKNYNIFINTQTLSDALIPGIPTSGGASTMTPKMREHREKFPDAVYYRFDCDTGSIIHLGVYERLKMPVVMVETPRHNFLRWNISSDQHVNWDVNDSQSYTDDEHRKGKPLTTGPFDEEDERKCHYLRDMPKEEVIHYHLAIAAGLYKKRQQIGKAASAYRESCLARPYSAMPLNNYAWLIATEPSLQRPELLDEALIMASAAVELRPTDDMFIDTLAAVHAARLDFGKAIATEKSGRNSPSRIKAYLDRKTPVELDWRSEPDEP